ncbi:Eco57I restriction-modification methylase domain-containing protein ['Fragaria x ananassa' phyllody phytoplasma]|uniref:site-specific DNA-methyltransferase (adenine-specific) n=1 Tax='Fragaria x ananassa' phyllody phytoplasma TaxID=2358428 RepID=A0ABS5K3C4_9MOLU|nr:N-6 DNA methylase ['Fragaria x ananassa' phyllody phytoplasma]MBS2126413.1 Eco57I restriction-modification methylase domain-containing protein ['Fragaria x ananassa' phyllody phytoplasma]
MQHHLLNKDIKKYLNKSCNFKQKQSLKSIFCNFKRTNKRGVVYTPIFIVKNMLATIGYLSQNILKKHIIDNSCGEGAFLIEIVNRYIENAKEKQLTEIEIAKDLEIFIHGIEIDYFSYTICINNLNQTLLNHGIQTPVAWDIINGDALEIKKYNYCMDYIVGNPPYIRIHDLNSKTNYKKYTFASKGMYDLYLIFFELSIKMLNNDGRMIYISPNSYFTSASGSKFRKYLIENKLLSKIINLGHFNPFKFVTTYPCITLIDKNNQNEVINYYEYDEKKLSNKFIAKLKYIHFFLNGAFYFSSLKRLINFKKITTIDKNPFLKIKNSVSTNLDSFFYNSNYQGEFIRSAFKISTFKTTNVFYPYNKQGILIPLEKIKKNNPTIYNILYQNEKKLNARSLQKQKWYEFARTQGILDIEKEKIVINNIIKNLETIKFKILSPGIVPYSGYYILSDKYDFEFIKKILIKQDFIEYLKILGKAKNGKYYFFSTTDLHLYLSYQISQI